MAGLTRLSVNSSKRAPDAAVSPGRAAAGAFCGGIALALAYPEADAFVLAWVAIAPLLVVVPRTTAWGALAAGAAFGLGFFGLLLSWISLVGWVAWGCLVALQTAFVIVFAAGWRRLHPALGPVGRVVAPALLWVAVEHLRASFPLGGFTWGELAQSQHDQTWLLRVAALGGTHAVSAVVCLSNALVAEGWIAGGFRLTREGLRRSATIVGLVALIPLAALLVPTAEPRGPALDVAVIQGNVPREWTGNSYEKDLAILDSHVRLTATLEPGEADLIVWPESSVGVDMQRDAYVGNQVAAAARRSDTPLVVGGNLDLDRDRYLVMAFHIGSDGEIVETYQKTHLVPFGEYVPRRDLLGFIPLLDQVPRDAVAGADATVFEIGGGEVAPVLSFEADFSSIVRRQIAAGGDLLVVGTNTSTWGESWASAQHVAMSQVRAAENRVWVVHAALSGISALIDASGRVVEEAPLWEPAVVRGRVRLSESQTPFTRAGDWIAIASLIASVLLLARASLGPRGEDKVRRWP